jgi:hypothetical protein
MSIRTRALEFKPIIPNRGGARLVSDSNRFAQTMGTVS